jgi:hypothetical protein
MMPEISRFLGIIISMYYEKSVKHHKPHIHIYYNEYEAVMALDGEILEGSFPSKQKKLVDAWIVLHEDKLYENWNKAVRNEALEKIEPLK